MNTASLRLAAAGLLGIAFLAGCSSSPKAPDVTGTLRQSLTEAGLKDVSVDQDREKGVVTLKGSVAADSDKMRAESIAKSVAGTQVVANEIAVLPPGAEGTAKTIDKDLDEGIKENLDAALLQNRLHDDVSYAVKNGVVTLTGDVNSQARRAGAQQIAAGVPNVAQVVNKLEVKNQKATSTQ
ncbi:MAG: BON domain-containing protein [Acidobacteriia bacterium]|nr:BON domain-containing protein [Terriglobia bacterium]